MKYAGVSGVPARLADLESSLRAARMLIRGLLTKPWLGHSGGHLFRGRGVTLLDAAFIRHDGRLVLEDFVEIQGVSEHGLRLGDQVSIGRGTTIRPSSYYGGDAGQGLSMGDRSSIGAGGFIGCSGWIEIGDDVMIGPGVRLFSENHVIERTDVTIKSQGVARGRLIIGDDCWIGSGVTIMANVEIGQGSVIAAGSVVTRDVPPFSVAAGVPAKVIRMRGEGK